MNGSRAVREFFLGLHRCSFSLRDITTTKQDDIDLGRPDKGFNNFQSKSSVSTRDEDDFVGSHDGMLCFAS